MPDLVVRAQISGWTDLRGECAAPSGDVYIVDAEARYVGSLSRRGEFHGIYRDGDGTPVSCADNPLNGDLAVTSNGASAGNILIYPGGVTGSGTPITVPHMHTYFFDGYDRSGHLWVDGYTADSKALIGSSTRSHCHTIPISGGTIFYPGFLQYASAQKAWYVADRECGGTMSSASIRSPPAACWEKQLRLPTRTAHPSATCSKARSPTGDARHSAALTTESTAAAPIAWLGGTSRLAATRRTEATMSANSRPEPRSALKLEIIKPRRGPLRNLMDLQPRRSGLRGRPLSSRAANLKRRR